MAFNQITCRQGMQSAGFAPTCANPSASSSLLLLAKTTAQQPTPHSKQKTSTGSSRVEGRAWMMTPAICAQQQ